MPTRKLVIEYGQDLELFPDRWHRIGVLCIGTFLMVFPMFASEHWLGISLDAMVAVVGSIAMMVLTGFTGQVSLGHAAFLAVGAYTVAILGWAHDRSFCPAPRRPVFGNCNRWSALHGPTCHQTRSRALLRTR